MHGAPLGRVLLVKHRRFNLWLPLGGEVEEGETPLEAAEREVREESKLRVRYPQILSNGAPPGLLDHGYGYEEHIAGSKGLHMNFNFVAINESGLTVVGDGSWSDHVWWPLGDIVVDETTTNVRHCLGRIAELRQQGRL